MIRLLTKEDYYLFEAMDTGLENDYIKLFFSRLTTANNCLYGLFFEGNLACVGGFTVYANRYAMLGRLRSDRRYRGRSFATEMMAFLRKKALEMSGIKWVGANTEEHNKPARRVLEKIGLTPHDAMYVATSKDISELETGVGTWQPIQSITRKKEWLHKEYVKKTKLFPYECYYPFPASEELFQEEILYKWTFYENAEKTRFVITKHDQKETHYLHVVYPWSDFSSQEGLWETIAHAHRQLTAQTGENTYIWMDLTKEEVQALPPNHPFEFPSLWTLYGEAKGRFSAS